MFQVLHVFWREVGIRDGGDDDRTCELSVRVEYDLRIGLVYLWEGAGER